MSEREKLSPSEGITIDFFHEFISDNEVGQYFSRGNQCDDSISTVRDTKSV